MELKSKKSKYIISLLNEDLLPRQVPVMKDHAHGYHIGLGELVLEEVKVLHSHTASEALLGYILVRHKVHLGQVARGESRGM